jgi:hypothetical protein
MFHVEQRKEVLTLPEMRDDLPYFKSGGYALGFTRKAKTRP